MIVLDYRDSRPLYQQVKDSLRRMMLTGLLEPDEKLPSVRSLATQLAINPNTIQRAYAELEAEGYIYSVAGRGSFVSAGDGEHLRRIIEKWGSERVLFATDSPWFPQKAGIDALYSAGLSAEAYENIFHRNAERLLKLV